jgi:hypothetical protein
MLYFPSGHGLHTAGAVDVHGTERERETRDERETKEMMSIMR